MTTTYRKIARESELDLNHYIEEHFFPAQRPSQVSFWEKAPVFRERLAGYKNLCHSSQYHTKEAYQLYDVLHSSMCHYWEEHVYMLYTPMYLLTLCFSVSNCQPDREFACCWLTMAFLCFDYERRIKSMVRDNPYALDKRPTSIN